VFGTPQNILQLVILLVQRYVTLTLAHLEEWQEDPESFLTGEEMDEYTEKKRVSLTNILSYFPGHGRKFDTLSYRSP
jgi:hypothetical protein